MTVDLSGLHDIHVPKEPSWWPPSIGWWLVMGGVMATTLIGYALFLKWYHQPKQYALRELKQTYEASPNIVALAKHVSILLKRIALIQYPRTKVATLSNEKWIDFLAKKTGACFSEAQLTLLAEATYMPEKSLSEGNPDELYKATKNAIQKLFLEDTHGRKSAKSS